MNLFQKTLRALFPTKLVTHRKPISARRSNSSLEFCQLEAKNLLTTFTLADSVLTINGTNDSEFVVLHQRQNGTIDLENAGVIEQTYNNEDVSRVIFRGRNGDDAFTNNSNIPSEFFGHGGFDLFVGGTGDDIAFGGGDDDQLSGGEGNDRLNGSDGNDVINGNEGVDTIFGGNGDDTIFGGEGDDFLSAEAGDDILFGGEGDDFLRGFLGDDEIHGGAGEDLVFGQAGDDIIFGNAGNDRLRGNNDNDIIHGDAGNDVLIGDVGDDRFFGGVGNDTTFGFTGDDFHSGGEGNDMLFDTAGNDTIEGGDGNDILRSGEGNDILNGGAGTDVLRGEAGNDRLYGGGGTDRLFAGSGGDSLHGGEGIEIDFLVGGTGSDRFHQTDQDDISDRVTEDVTIEYVTDFVAWRDLEIESIDRGFNQIYELAGNSNELFRETFNGANQNVTIHKVGELPGIAQHRNIINPLTNEREIQILDTNENSTSGQRFFQQAIVEQLAHNWNSPEELQQIFGNLESEVWSEFLALSQWTQTNPQNSEFLRSGDGQWWYHQSAAFANFGSAENPHEDFVDVWVAAVNDVFSNSLQSKVDWINSTLFQA